jgi:hypothetical protein
MMGICVIYLIKLVFVGNTRTLDTQEKKNEKWQPTSMHLNFINYANNLDPEYKFVIMQNFKLGKEITIREYLGYFNHSMLFVVEDPPKYSIHRLCP